MTIQNTLSIGIPEESAHFLAEHESQEPRV